MRLTVRTLLAWLDHVLPADEQKQMGDKVIASVAAQQLVERIRRVVEQPTISAPRVDGKGLAADPNSVAEYLDNTLEPEKLEAFERICFESDMHLAEVAACHNLVAGAAADATVSVLLDAAGRQRLLAGMQHRSAALFAEVERREAVDNARAVQAALQSAAATEQGTDHDETVLFDKSRHPLPSSPKTAGGVMARDTSSRRTSLGAWAAAIMALTLLLVLGGLLVQSLMTDRGRTVAARVEPIPAAAEPPGREEPTPQVAAEPLAAGSSPAADEEPAAPIETAAAATVEKKIEQAEQAEQAEPSPPAAPEPVSSQPAPNAEATPPALAVAVPPPVAADAPRVPFGDALAIAATAPPAPTAATPPATEEPEEPEEAPEPEEASPFAAPTGVQPSAVAPPRPAIGFVGTDGLLLHRTIENGQPAWVPFAAGTAIHAREDLIAPAGFHPDVNIRGVRIRLLPGTRATVSLDPDGTPRIEMAFGRAVVRASSGDARLAVTADGLVGTIIAGLTEPVAISVELQRFAGSDPTPQSTRVRAWIVAASGGLVWRQAEEPQGLLEGVAAEGMLEARTAMTWDSFRPRAATLERLPSLPEWIASAPASDRLEKAACEAVAAKVAAVAPLERALRELAADRRVENRILAVSTLALLGDYDDLVELLCADAPGRKLEGRQWLMLETATVPLALARGELAASRLREAFESRGPHGKAEALDAMARGFTNEELAAGGDAALVAALDDDDLVVRRYAIKCLCDVMQPSATDRLRYRPDGLPDLRREGVNWWRGQLEKELIRRTEPRPAAAGSAR